MPPEHDDEVATAAPEGPAKQERKHKATYATDNRNGGYLIRVQGPYPERFANRDVPVSTKAGKEHVETLEKLIWKGLDQTTGQPVALYKFKAKPRDTEKELEF